jgi:hypothetical protein
MSDPKRNDPKDGWQCPRCSAHNGAYRRECWYCDAGRRPADTEALTTG